MRRNVFRCLCASDADRTGQVSARFLLGAVLWAVVLVWGVLLFTRQAADQPVDQPVQGDSNADSADAEPLNDAGASEDPADRVIFPSREIPDFQLSECRGGTLSRDDLRGRPWVASFIFTRCMSTCPQITLEVKNLHDRLKESRPDVRFVSISVDPGYDTPAVLQQYADVYSADPERWKFLTGSEADVLRLVVEGFAQYVQPNLSDVVPPGFEVAHSNRVVLVNEENIPVATFLATKPEEIVRLRRILEGKDEFPQPGPPIVPGQQYAIPPVDFLQGPEGEDDPEKTQPPAGEQPDPDQDALISPATDYRLAMWRVADEAPLAGSELPESVDVNQTIDARLPAWAARLPSINAALNLISTFLLITGYRAIRRGRRTTHRNLMVSAFVASIAFLGCYLVYHWALGRYTGQHGRAFTGPNWARMAYFSVLWPHVSLAAAVPFLAVRVLWLAAKGRWEQHRRIAKITLPVWLFVSVTGVVIYLMLYHWPATTTAGTV